MLRDKIEKKPKKKKKQQSREWVSYLIYKQNKIKWKQMKQKNKLKRNPKQRKTNKKRIIIDFFSPLFFNQNNTIFTF